MFLVNILVQNVASNLFGDYSSWLLTVGFPLILTLIFGEVIPKCIAINNNERLSYWVAPIIASFRFILGPLGFLLTFLTRHLARLFFFFLKKEKRISTPELKQVLRTSEQSGVLNTDERTLIHGYLNLQDMLVKELMRPREEILFFDLSKPLSELTIFFTEQELSRVPVCRKNIENIEGVITVKNFFLHRHKLTSSTDILPFLEKPYFVPEAMSAKNLLNQLNSKNDLLAIVVNEYGVISGLITREDLVEIVVGEIVDKRDAKVRYTLVGENTIIASGKLELAEFEHIFHIPLDSDMNMVTIGGWLTEQLGTIPKTGMKYTTNHFFFHVLAADPNRVRRIYIRQLAKDDTNKTKELS